MFTGRIGEEYGFLSVICPNVAVLIRNLGAAVAAFEPEAAIRGLEIGCGTGLSTLSLLSQRENLHLRALDASPAMLKQARDNLSDYVGAGRLELIESDALDFLRRQPDASVDVVASNYAIHNFRNDYRAQVSRKSCACSRRAACSRTATASRTTTAPCISPRRRLRSCTGSTLSAK
jgi:SAM-dependent methyltransferase